MLQIRLNRAPSTDSGGGLKPLPVDTVTVACPDHLVIADLPVAKGIGAATSATAVKTLGRRSRRQLGERVHFCVRCDFPIAIYGRLSPCDHAFCLDCARSDSICYLCDERIQKIQTIKLMEGIFICAAPHCLKSFLKRTEFESHILENHAALIQPNADKEDANESEAQSTKQQTPSESAARGPARSVVSPASNSQFHDREDKARLQQPWEQMPLRPIMPPKQPFTGQVQNFSSEAHLDINRPPGFDLPGPHNPFQQSFETQGTPRQESGQFSDKQQGVLHETFYPGYPSMHSIQPPNFVIPLNSNSFLSPQVGVPPFPAEGGQPFYGTPYEMGHISRSDKAVERGPEPGSLLGFPPGAAGGANFLASYPQPWTAVPSVMPFESVPGGQGMPDGFTNMSDAQGKVAFYQGDYGRNPGGLPMVPPLPPVNRPMEAGNSMDPRDSKGILAPQPVPHQAPPPPPPPHLSQHKNKYHSGDMGRDGRGFGWQHENRDGFGSGQD